VATCRGLKDGVASEEGDQTEQTLVEVAEDHGVDVTIIPGDDVRTATAIAGCSGGGRTEPRSLESPEHAVRIRQALDENGPVDAMTGAGIDDTPALKNADVGAAIGARRTDVGKSASDVVRRF